MSKGRRMRKGDKLYIARHRRQCSASADSLDKMVETADRRDAQREIAEQIEDMDPQERGTWAAIDSWWG